MGNVIHKFTVFKSCLAYPTQYEGVDEETGVKIYIRYRWGYLGIYGWTDDFAERQEIFGCFIGGPWDGDLKDTEVIQICQKFGIEIKIAAERITPKIKF